ncbi:MAG: MBL fold metallo-hydrolase [Clostridia bacterium]|nr:MBL fold metallo-hydrolase [Clostridia bacterium]
MNKRIFALFLALLLSLTALVSCGGLGFSDFPYGESGTDGQKTEPQETEPQETDAPQVGNGSIESSFAVHFIDVGQADAALIRCTGKTMLIDGGNKEDSDLIYTYLKKQGITHLDYVVCTHAHEDHVGGLSGALTAVESVGHVLSPVTDYDSRAFRDFVTKTEAHGRTLEIPRAGESFLLGDATVTVLGPVKAYDETNDTSIVLRVVYGETSFLFTGDMEGPAETDLIESGASLKSTVLKVGHHGSSTSTSYRFLREVAPSHAVISVGKDNQYDHPNEEVLSRLRDAEVKLYRTDLQGDVICVSDGKNVSFTTAKNSDIQTNPTENDKTPSGEMQYIGNKNSKVYHLPTCSSLPNEENRVLLSTKEEAEQEGYRACGRCHP